MALGCSSRPNPFFPWLQEGARGRTGVGSELGGQPSFALLHRVLLRRFTQALPYVGYQATKLQQESWRHVSAEPMPSQQGRDAEPGCAWKGPRTWTSHLESRIRAPNPQLTQSRKLFFSCAEHFQISSISREIWQGLLVLDFISDAITFGPFYAAFGWC